MKPNQSYENMNEYRYKKKEKQEVKITDMCIDEKITIKKIIQNY